LNTSIIQNRILAVQTNNAQPKLALKEIRSFKINYPSLNEQKKISKFLSLVDSKIELLEEKYENYINFKKYLMQQIFAQKLRFDFSEEWKITKLGEITSINTGKKDVKDKKDDGKYPFFVRSEKIERIDSYSFDGEAILIPGDGKIGEVYHYINGKFDYHQRVYKISNFHNDVFGKYIYFYLEKNFLRQAMKNTAKATVDSLRMDTLTKMPIELPSFEEQIKIANSLTFTDEKINLAKNNIDVANKFKKGLLQQMFI
jgi:type I restriction enzyme S subunit